MFLARHGMAGEESMPRISPKRFCGARDNLRLRAAHVRDQRFCNQRRSEPIDQIEDRKHRSRQHDQFAASYGIRWMGGPGVDGAAVLGPFQNWSAVASHDASGEAPFLQGEA